MYLDQKTSLRGHSVLRAESDCAAVNRHRQPLLIHFFFSCFQGGNVSDDVTMRMSPPLGLVLVAAVTLLANANANAETSLRIDSDTATSSPSVSSSLSSSYRFGKKDRDQVIAGMEASLLSLLGFTKRPRPQGQTYIPKSLRELHARQNAIGIADIAKPGIHARSANTVRSFPHIGKLDCSDLALYSVRFLFYKHCRSFNFFFLFSFFFALLF